jgi:acetyltransferase-like isoleucine patch superfamily enzyme
MLRSEIVTHLMFDYETLTPAQIQELAGGLGNKLVRWLGINHPDNRIRLIFLRQTNVAIGDETVINRNFVISDDYEPLVTIGDRVAISPNVTIIAASGPNNSRLNHNAEVRGKLIIKAPVHINDDVWIGAGAIIMPGVTVGRSAIVGAGAVVTHNVPDGWIVAGNPARKLRQLAIESRCLDMEMEKNH